MDGIEHIWKDYHVKLRNFIRSRVGDGSIADDILQEVFIRIHTRINTLRDSRKIQGWIYQITRNAIIDYYRAHKTMGELPETLTAPRVEPVDEARREIASWLVPMIQTFPEHYRQALELSEVEGLTQKEVAVKQGLSLSGAKARVQRGRKMLKKMLLDCCQFEFDHQGTVIDWEKKDSDSDCNNC
jgi:RNA polymerase sigma-70 factor (ECF subfamily)